MPKRTRRTSRRSIRRSPALSGGSALVALLVIAILLLYSYLGQEAASPALPSVTAALPAAAEATLSSDWYSLYFTVPGSPESISLQDGPAEALIAAIEQARSSIDLAVYEIDLESAAAALAAAHRRGVAVRVVTDSDYLDEDAAQAIKKAGIPVLGDRRESLMHNKFVIIDRQEVWLGSMNLTSNDAYRNNNNLLRVRSSRLAESYTAEFEEMFAGDHFGADDVPQTPYPTVTVDGSLLEVYFSPDDGTASRLVELIQGAQQSVYFLSFSFTSDDLASAMLARAQAGVIVAGVFDESQYNSNIGTEFDHFQQAGLDVRLDGNPRFMHHKVIIIDGQTVVTGSYNFSANAEERNDENTLVIHNAEVAGRYMEEFERLFTEAQE